MPLNFGYAGVLRCIGQALQKRNIDIFELKSSADEFRLQAGDPHPPYIALIEMRFSTAQIEVLDREGKMRRSQSNDGIRFDSIPEILRGIGGYVDSHRGQLLREAGKLQEALAEFQKASEIDPSSFIAQQELRRTQRLMDSANAPAPRAAVLREPGNAGRLDHGPRRYARLDRSQLGPRAGSALAPDRPCCGATFRLFRWWAQAVRSAVGAGGIGP